MKSLYCFSRIQAIPVQLAASLFLGTLPISAQTPAPHGFGQVNSYVSGSGNSTVNSLGEVRCVGDFNSDGLDDLVLFRRSGPGGDWNGDALVWLNSEDSGFRHQEKWHEFFCVGEEIPLVGDFNGDGYDDVSTFLRGGAGDVYVSTSNGLSFGTSSIWHGSFCFGDEIPVVADINGDGKDDILTFTRGTSKRVYAALSTGTGFTGSGVLWHADFCPGEALPFAGDVNGDGKDDIIAFYRSSQTGIPQGDVMVALSSGSGFGTPQKWHDWFAIGDQVPLVGDLNTDGRVDIVTCSTGSSGDVFVAMNTGTSFQGTGLRWSSSFPSNYQDLVSPLIGRFNPDLNDDLLTAKVSSRVIPRELPQLPILVTEITFNEVYAGGHESDGAPGQGPFIPFLTAPFNPTVNAGQLIPLEGNLGFRSLGGSLPALIDEEGRHYFLEGSWWETNAELVAPVALRPGKYQLVVYEELGSDLVSNSLPITIRNPYWAWADVELLEIMSSHPHLADPLEDADKDGWPNIGEFLMDSDPLDTGAHPELRLQFGQSPEGGTEATFSWTERRTHAEFVHARPQRSTDLVNWQNLGRGGISADAQYATYGATPFNFEPKQYIRLKFTTKELP